MDDPYKILGVERTASADEIRSAYRKLAKSLHPDANPGDKAAEERFKKVSQAFRILSDADKRAEYDAMAAEAARGGRPFHFRQGRNRGRPFEDVSDLFADLFTDFGADARTANRAGHRSAHRPRAARGADVRHVLKIDFLDAMKGAKRRVELSGAKPLDITIPVAAEDGQLLRLRGQGEPGAHGGPAGDALIELQIRPHPYFSREGDNIRLELPVSLKEAALGAKVRAPTIDGPVDVRVPPGSTSGGLLRLRGKGLAGKGGKRGDQIIRLLVAVPERDEALRSFLENWSPPADHDPRKGMRST